MKARVLRVRFLLACAGWSLLCLGGIAAGAPDPGHTEAEVKAAFVLNFVRYTAWPRRAVPPVDGAWIVGVRDAPEVEAALRALAQGETVHARALRIVRLQPGDALPAPLHVLYSGEAASPAKRTAGVPVLTVGEGSDFARAGGVIRVFVEDSRVRFEVNPQAADNAGLGLSSQLLKLARIVGH